MTGKAKLSINGNKIVGFCCNYTSRISEEALKNADLVSEEVSLKRVPCTGSLEVAQMLSAFENGADAVFVAGCTEGTCHNLSGSYRANKRVQNTKKILKELEINPGLLEMFFVERGETEPIVKAVEEMQKRLMAGKEE
jgi:F420-non-reducing hydrogenase iron-sulfur subunit